MELRTIRQNSALDRKALCTDGSEWLSRQAQMLPRCDHDLASHGRRYR